MNLGRLYGPTPTVSRQRSGSHGVYLDAINILIRPSRLISLDLLQI